MTEALLTASEIARRLGTYRADVLRLARKLNITPPVQNARLWIFSPEQADKLMAAYKERRNVAK